MCPSLREVWIFTGSCWPIGMDPGQPEDKWSCPRSWANTEPCLEAAHQPWPGSHAWVPFLYSPSFSLSPLQSHSSAVIYQMPPGFPPSSFCFQIFPCCSDTLEPPCCVSLSFIFSMRNFLTRNFVCLSSFWTAGRQFLLPVLMYPSFPSPKFPIPSRIQDKAMC